MLVDTTSKILYIFSQIMQSQYTDGFFNVSPKYGFLPVSDPLKKLPDEYVILQRVIDSLPDTLSKKDLIETVILTIPDYRVQVIQETDVMIIQALYRAYCFLTSGYLLEKSHNNNSNKLNLCPMAGLSASSNSSACPHEFSEKYGPARRVLPENIAMPFTIVAKMLSAKPYLDYHYAYSLGNYVKKDNHGSLDWRNLDMACRFSNTTDEVGFIMLHVYINDLSPKLVEATLQIINSNNFHNSDYCGTIELGDVNTDTKSDISQNDFNIIKGLELYYDTMIEMNKRRKEMWEASDHKNYNNFRVFLMGIKGNTQLFGPGVIYQGVDPAPLQFSGQTGAQDDIIPTGDILTGLINYYPDNDLTQFLLGLREYRPVCIQNFFADLEKSTKSYGSQGLIDKINQMSDRKIRNNSLVYLLAIVDQIYLFRNDHWQFVQKYILENTKYPVATGGTPITSWLPNQIDACLRYQSVIIDLIDEKCLSDDVWILRTNLVDKLDDKINLLKSQISELTKSDYDVSTVYGANVKFGLVDMKK